MRYLILGEVISRRQGQHMQQLHPQHNFQIISLPDAGELDIDYDNRNDNIMKALTYKEIEEKENKEKEQKKDKRISTPDYLQLMGGQG